ncbi:hypothetical protein H0H92_002074, partial [Tricholoma furcatifolium]
MPHKSYEPPPYHQPPVSGEQDSVPPLSFDRITHPFAGLELTVSNDVGASDIKNARWDGKHDLVPNLWHKLAILVSKTWLGNGNVYWKEE